MDNIIGPRQNNSINIKDLILGYFSYWPWFLVSVIVCLVVGYIYASKQVYEYEVRASILVKEEKSLLDDRINNNMGFVNTSSSVSDQVGILRSYSLTKKAIQRLDFNISYFKKGRFKDEELYKSSPFIIVADSASSLPLYTPVYVEFDSPTTYSVYFEAKYISLYNIYTKQISTLSEGSFKVKLNGNLFRRFVYNNISFKIVPNNNRDLSEFVGQKFYFVVYDDKTLYGIYNTVNTQENKSSSIITLCIQGTNVMKLVDFLNTLTQVYLERGLARKNQIADNTIHFINSQLGDVSDSLYSSEKTLQNYRAQHSVMDFNFVSQQVYNSLENLKSQRSEIIVKLKYFDYLQKYLNEKNDGKDMIIPSSLDIKDNSLNTLINELINLNTDRAELAVNSKQDNPYLVTNELRIKNTKQSIFRNIEGLSSALKLTLQDIDKRINEISGKASMLPEAQRKLIGYERKFKLNDALYTYLLTKLSETQINKASLVPDNEILDEATPECVRLISTNYQTIYFLALVFGLSIPFLILFLRDFLNVNVQSDEDIETVTNYPLLGHIIKNIEKTHTVITDYPLSQTSESIRSIRTNFQFLLGATGPHTILVTSSMMGEGKSFTSLNLALSFTLYKKKTVLLNFDLRKPKLDNYLGIDCNYGLSAFLSGNCGLDEIICKSQFEYLDFILAGVIPPNPAELIAGTATGTLFNSLKEHYDYIIIDTPPVGIVTDAMLLLKYSDVNIYIVRQNYTPKKLLSQTLKDLSKRGVSKINIILNDIKINRGYYSYSYKYKNHSN